MAWKGCYHAFCRLSTLMNRVFLQHNSLYTAVTNRPHAIEEYKTLNACFRRAKFHPPLVWIGAGFFQFIGRTIDWRRW